MFLAFDIRIFLVLVYISYVYQVTLTLFLCKILLKSGELLIQSFHLFTEFHSFILKNNPMLVF